MPQTYLHIGFWILYLIYTYFLNWLTNKDVDINEILSVYILLILFFYLVVFGFNLLKKNNYVAIVYFLGLFLSFTTGGYFVLRDFLPILDINIITKSFTFSGYLQAVIAETTKFFIMALLYFVVKEFFQKQKEIQQIEFEKNKQVRENADLIQRELMTQKEKVQYQYAFLRARINPHFLFNTLNFIYSQSLEFSEPLANNILKLSDIMRYSLDDSEEQNLKVTLKKELKYLKVLIDIYQLRFGAANFIDFKIKGIADNQLVPPLSYITIVENALKYGDLKERDYPIQINIIAQPEKVEFSCRNKIKKNVVNMTSNNIGINNLRQRLDISFMNKYEIKIEKEQDFYTFNLVIFQK